MMVNERSSIDSTKALLSTNEMAQILGIPYSTAMEWVHRGLLPGVVKVGRRFYIRRAALYRWLAGESD